MFLVRRREDFFKTLLMMAWASSSGDGLEVVKPFLER